MIFSGHESSKATPRSNHNSRNILVLCTIIVMLVLPCRLIVVCVGGGGGWVCLVVRVVRVIDGSTH